MERHEYSYSLLPQPQSGCFQIRVAELLKGSKEETICISISTLQVREDTTYHAEYEALSYTWGDLNDPRDIDVQQASSLARLTVGDNLFNALKHLRSTTENRKLWIDAICINQDPKDKDESEEKNWCVRIMHLIYSCASRVVIWLGLGDLSSQHAMLALSDLGSRFEYDDLTSTIKPIPDHQMLPDSLVTKWDTSTYQAIASLLQSPWFTRVWIRQEAFSASSSSLLQIGDFTIPVLSFLGAINTLANEPMEVGKTDVSGYTEGLMLSMSVFQKAFSSILDIMSRIRMSDCTMLQDKVYGTLGMIAISTGDSTFVEGIEVDYKKPFGQVFLDFFLHYFACKRHLRLLREGGLCQGSELQPSWLPDWSRPLPASLDLSMEAAVSHGMFDIEACYLGSDTFRVNGVPAAKIKQVVIMEKIHHEPTITFHQLCEQLRGIMKELLPPEPSETTLESFARGLCAYLPSLRVPLEDLEIQRQDIIRYISMVYNTGTLETYVDAKHPDSINTFFKTLQFFRQSRMPLICTEDGHVGVGCPATRPEDLVCAVLGINNLTILRATATKQYQLIGSAFLHGLNWGEALLGLLPDGIQVLPRLIPEKGFYQPYYVNAGSGEASYWDPRIRWNELQVEAGVGGIPMINGPNDEPMRRMPGADYFKRHHGATIQIFDLI